MKNEKPASTLYHPRNRQNPIQTTTRPHTQPPPPTTLYFDANIVFETSAHATYAHNAADIYELHTLMRARGLETEFTQE